MHKFSHSTGRRIFAATSATIISLFIQQAHSDVIMWLWTATEIHYNVRFVEKGVWREFYDSDKMLIASDYTPIGQKMIKYAVWLSNNASDVSCDALDGYAIGIKSGSTKKLCYNCSFCSNTSETSIWKNISELIASTNCHIDSSRIARGALSLRDSLIMASLYNSINRFESDSSNSTRLNYIASINARRMMLLDDATKYCKESKNLNAIESQIDSIITSSPF